MPASALIWAVAAIALQLRQARLDANLITAIKASNSGRAIALLDQGADANAADDPARPITMHTVLREALDVMRGVRPVRSHRASALLLECGDSFVMEAGKPHYKRRYRVPTDAPTLQALLRHGADVRARTKAPPETALQLEIERGDLEAITLLLDHGADPNDATYESPLGLAADHDQFAAAKLLLNRGAQVAAVGTSGATALQLATTATPGDRIVRLFLDHGAMVNERANTGSTGLIDAAGGLNPTRVALLLDYGANPSLRDNAGNCALDVASWHTDCREKREIIRLIQSAIKRGPIHPLDATSRNRRKPR